MDNCSTASTRRVASAREFCTVVRAVFRIAMDNAGEHPSQVSRGQPNTQRAPAVSSAPTSHTASPVSLSEGEATRRWSSSSSPVLTSPWSTTRRRYSYTTPGARVVFSGSNRSTPDLPATPIYPWATQSANRSSTPSSLDPLLSGAAQTPWLLTQPRPYTPEQNAAESLFNPGLQEPRPTSRQGRTTTQYPSEPGSSNPSATSSPATFAYRTAPPLPSLSSGFRSGSPVGASFDSTLPSLHRR